MLKKKWLVGLTFILLLSFGLIYTALKQAKHFSRDPVILLNAYYHLKVTHPEAAQKALLIILQQDNRNVAALAELSQWLLAKHQYEQAFPLLIRLHELRPYVQTYTLQLAYLYFKQGNWQQSKALFAMLPNNFATQIAHGLAAMGSYMPFYRDYVAVEYAKLEVESPSISSVNIPTEQPLQQFYRLKNKDPKAAFELAKQWLQAYPQQVQVLKEAGYLALQQGCLIEAIDYFTRAYCLTKEPHLAMQLAYLHEQLADPANAYLYFRQATRGDDLQITAAANNAMTNLAGRQTKALPHPYFLEMYFNPFSQSRFGITVTPLILRAGVEQSNRLQTKEYVYLRRTTDNRSANLGELSQLYEDNVQIVGMGGQFTPFRRIPLLGFIEAGIANDLVYQNREPWRGDLRVGFMYYQPLGTRPAYYNKLTLGYPYYSDWYADVVYFSRYNNNVIGLVRTHQGVRLLQYHDSMLNVYMTGRFVTDTRREFFNNFAEIGPGVGWIPSNRFNFELRLEHINGVYLPAGGSINPYSTYYGNNLIQMLFYVKI